MIKLRTNLVLLWTVLILGLILAGACSNNNPTTPDPSDVLGLDPSGAPEIQALIDSYTTLRDQGGGVISEPDPDASAIIGTFDRYSGDAIWETSLTISENDGTVTHIDFTDMIIIPSLDYPITVTVSSPGCVQKTIYQTNSNVIAIPMDLMDNGYPRAFVIGFSFNNGFDPPEEEPWAVQASSSHLGCDWDKTIGMEGSSPGTLLTVNPWQNVGCIAFLYGLIDPPPVSPPSDPVDPWERFELTGYSWSNIGSLVPEAIGGWIINLTEEGQGTDYGSANYSFAYTPPTPDSGALANHIADLTILPGGSKDASSEFIPYYPLVDLDAVDTGSGPDGTYDLNAFLPPVSVDRILIMATADYSDGCFERQFATWDPAGAVPDITFGIPASTDSAVLFMDQPHLTFDCAWTDATPGGTPGFQVVTVVRGDYTIWELYVGTDARDVAFDLMGDINESLAPDVNEDLGGNDYGLSVNITRYNSAGIILDDFDFQRVWANSTSWITGLTQPVD